MVSPRRATLGWLIQSRWDCAAATLWNGAARSARRERQRRSIIQPKVVSFQRNCPGSIPPNQTANPERVEPSLVWLSVAELGHERRDKIAAISNEIGVCSGGVWVIGLKRHQIGVEH